MVLDQKDEKRSKKKTVKHHNNKTPHYLSFNDTCDSIGKLTHE